MKLFQGVALVLIGGILGVGCSQGVLRKVQAGVPEYRVISLTAQEIPATDEVKGPIALQRLINTEAREGYAYHSTNLSGWAIFVRNQ